MAFHVRSRRRRPGLGALAFAASAILMPMAIVSHAAEVPSSVLTMSNINRLQFRYVTRGGYSVNQTMFARWSNGFFLLGDVEHNSSYGTSPRHQRLDFIAGGELTGPVLGWAVRLQKISFMDPVESAGIQFNITDLPALREAAKRNRISTFVQFFPLKSDQSHEILHYYQAPLFQPVYVRGTNSWIRLHNGNHYRRIFADFIYPIRKSFETYIRYSWQNRSDVQYGVTGATWAIGARYNFSY